MLYWSEFKERLDKIYNAMQDEESKRWFDARIDFMLNRDFDSYTNTVIELNKLYPKDWRLPEIERVLEKGQDIIIYGCGHDGKMMKKVLEICGYSIIYWCDSNRKLLGTYVEGIQVISPEELMPAYQNCLLIIGSKKYESDIRKRCFAVGFPSKNIFSFAWNPCIGRCGTQYFDVFSPHNREVFVDAGAYDGQTSIDFLSWFKGNDYKIYSLELKEDMCDVIKEKNIPNIEVINCAVWNKNEKLFIEIENERGSSAGRKGEKEVEGRSIDEVVKENEEITFIKMDIEGAELKALEGARKTILKYTPRLAISIYHKFLDIYEIADYILQLNSDYKFYIRHYTTGDWETILYAYV